MIMCRYFGFLMLFIVLSFACTRNEAETRDKIALFSQLDSTRTGINFKNVLTSSNTLNIIEFTYFYNGGGVAAADFNNDGLEDLYFVSNQHINSLYLNKGNLNFEDITHTSGVGGKSDWNTGVTVADVNNDGYMDIYVCAVTDFAGLKGKNELFMNNGDLTFTESAAEYGLDLKTHATQAVFFDFDHDGDLDCYVLNYALEEAENYVPVGKGRLQDSLSGDYLLKNDNGKFKDVTLDSGILQSKIGFGLSVSVADFNNDGWEDIYVANDFHEDDYFYLNKKDGTFKESGRQYFKHFSRFSMGSDVADINNDGYFDIINLDMYPEQRSVEKMSVGEDSFDIYAYKLSYGYYNQYAKNSLQLNNSGKGFSDISSYSGVAATDWSWASLFADFDNDRVKDLYISNGIPKRPNDLDFIDFVLNYQKRDPASVDLDAYLTEAIGKMPSGKYHDFIYKGTDSLRFIDKSQEWGFGTPSISNGTVYSDLDNDGDLDLVINRLNDQMGVFENKASESGGNNYVQVRLQGENGNRNGVGSKVALYHGGTKQVQQLINTRGFQSALGNTLHFGLGKYDVLDSLKVIWNGGKTQTLTSITANQKILVNQGNFSSEENTDSMAAPRFTEVNSPITYSHDENAFNDFNREPLMPFKVSTEGPAMAISDINNDGLDDIFLGGARNQEGELWLQEKDGTFARSSQSHFVADAILEQVDAVFFDADADGDEDLYVVVAGNEFFGEMENQVDCLYLNDGNGNFEKSGDRIPKMFMNSSCVRPSDFDNDGDIDLFIGGRVVSKSYGLNPQSYLLENNGEGYFTDVAKSKAKDLQFSGMVTDAKWLDVDNDKDDDLILVGEWMDIKLYKNEGGDLIESPFSNKPYHGLWHTLESVDIDNDGDLDVMAGNLGTNTKFYRNGSEELRMYVKDFDGNGAVEQIVTYQENGKWYPIEGRDELGKTLPSIIKKRFSTHKDFSDKAIDEIFTEAELKDSEILKVNTLSTLYFENQGQGKYVARKLPKEVNYSTVFSILHLKEQRKLLLAGNFLGTNTWQVPHDAGYGLTLTYEPAKALTNEGETGFFVMGEVRKMDTIQIKGRAHIVVAKNNAPLQFFEISD